MRESILFHPALQMLLCTWGMQAGMWQAYKVTTHTTAFDSRIVSLRHVMSRCHARALYVWRTGWPAT